MPSLTDRTNILAWQHFLHSQGFALPKFGIDGDFGSETADATRGYQTREGLPTTGDADAATLARAAQQGFVLPGPPAIIPPDQAGSGFPPPPKGLKAPTVESQQILFGPLVAVSAPVPGNPEAIRITNHFDLDNVVRITIPELAGIPGAPANGAIFWHRKAVGQMQALWGAWNQAGLVGRVLGWGGSFVPRYIRGSTTQLSNHAFAVAFDINVPWNGLGVQPALVGKTGSVRELVPLANRLGFFWGGHYKTRADGMHFEVARIMTAEEIAAALT